MFDKQLSNLVSPDIRRQHGHQDGEAALPQRAHGHPLREAAPAHLAQEDWAEGRGHWVSP